MVNPVEIDANALLEKYGSGEDRQPRRRNIQILFSGLSSEETAPIISLLRTSRFSPRGASIEAEQEFLDALSERSWDLIVCQLEATSLPITTLIDHLRRLDKDIPLIQIIPEQNSEKMIEGLKLNLHAVVPQDDKALLLHCIKSALSDLDQRRRLRQLEGALIAAEKDKKSLVESSKYAIADCDQGKITAVNQSFIKLFGFDNEQLVLGKEISERFVTEERLRFNTQLSLLHSESSRNELLQQTRVQRSDRSEITTAVEISLRGFDQASTCTRIVFRIDDQFSEQFLEDDLDFISGLYNKAFLDKQLEQAIHNALLGGYDCSLLFVLLDRYDDIRAESGHEGCDQLVREIAQLLHKTVPSKHLIAHPQDNAFAILFNDASMEHAIALGTTLTSKIRQISTQAAGRPLHTTSSIGITLINDNAPSRDEIYSRAYSAALSLVGGDAVQVFTPEASLTSGQREAREQIGHAIENRDFKLLYQPVVNLTSEDQVTHHYEVLLRLLNSEQEELSPNLFMEHIQDPEQLKMVDKWVIEHSLRTLKKSLEKQYKNKLFINLSAASIDDQQTAHWIAETLREHEVPADRIIFQISESEITMLPQASASLAEKLYRMHCQICIKHFGSSASADRLLHQISCDYIKLDGSYVHELGKNRNQDDMFFELVEKLHRFDKKTIAPLVEDTKVMALLWKAQIAYVQGYYLQQPRQEMDYDFFQD